jgi:20S proteasome subunit alpha 7
MKNEYGLVLITEKPKTSPLYILETDEKIRKVTSTVSIVSTGIVSDGLYVSNTLKDLALEHKEDFNENPSSRFIKMYLNDIFHYFTRGLGVRVLGVNTLTSVCNDNKFSLFHTDCTGRTVPYKASCLGRGARRIKTELEKLDIDNMSVEDMVENGVRMLYMAYDPSKDKEFDIEVGVISPESEGLMRKLSKDEVKVFVDKYSHITVDDN